MRPRTRILDRPTEAVWFTTHYYRSCRPVWLGWAAGIKNVKSVPLRRRVALLGPFLDCRSSTVEGRRRSKRTRTRGNACRGDGDWWLPGDAGLGRRVRANDSQHRRQQLAATMTNLVKWIKKFRKQYYIDRARCCGGRPKPGRCGEGARMRASGTRYRDDDGQSVPQPWHNRPASWR